jgi:hypothetical protein
VLGARDVMLSTNSIIVTCLHSRALMKKLVDCVQSTHLNDAAARATAFELCIEQS